MNEKSSIKSQFTVREIPPAMTHDWVLRKHYAHRVPSIVLAYGIYNKVMVLQGICTYGIPVSNQLCEALCGVEYKRLVLELTRLCLNEGLPKNTASFFIAHTFKLLPKPHILVSYSDTAFGHHGYIYQATNWLYTGTSIPFTDIKNSLDLGAHQRHSNDLPLPDDQKVYVERSIKHRYVNFVGDKSWYRKMRGLLKYPVLPYPKGDNQRYDSSYRPPLQGVLI